MRTAVNMSALRYWYASLLTSNADSDEQRRRMNLALQTLRDAFEQEHKGTDPVKHVQDQVVALPERSALVPYLVELWAIPPFAPHAIEVPEEVRLEVLDMMLHALQLPFSASDLKRHFSNAVRAYSPRSKLGVAVKVVGAAAATGAVIMATALAFATGGLTAAPTAAAITTALATLGGGAVATGGFGMVGGIALLVMGSAAGGGLAFYTQQVLQQLGADGLRVELTKLETTQRLWWEMHAKTAPSKAKVLEQQKQLLAQLESLLDRENMISEAKSEPIKEWEAMIKLVKTSIERLGSAHL